MPTDAGRMHFLSRSCPAFSKSLSPFFMFHFILFIYVLLLNTHAWGDSFETDFVEPETLRLRWKPHSHDDTIFYVRCFFKAGCHHAIPLEDVGFLETRVAKTHPCSCPLSCGPIGRQQKVQLVSLIGHFSCPGAATAVSEPAMLSSK